MIRGQIRTQVNRLVSWVPLHKRLPAEFGKRKLRVTSAAYLRYWTHDLGTIHADLLRAIGEWLQPGDCFWDIGANVGVAAFAAAHLVGRQGSVLAAEADVDVCGLLQRSAALGSEDDAPMTILPIACGDHVGLTDFAISQHGTTTNALAGFGRLGAFRQSRRVMMFTLDWLAQHTRTPTLIKIDVEGAELLVFRGAAAVLAQYRPVILCEVGDDVADEVSRFLTERGYALFDARSRPDRRTPLSRSPGELLAVHPQSDAAVRLRNASAAVM